MGEEPVQDPNLPSLITLAPRKATNGGIKATDPQTGIRMKFEPLVLRSMCRCQFCVDESTQQRFFSLSDIPPSIQVKSVKAVGFEAIEVTWLDDVAGFDQRHRSTFTAVELMDHTGFHSQQKASHDTTIPHPWNCSQLERQRPKLEFDARGFLNEDTALNAAVSALIIWGIIFITDVPHKSESVNRLMERFGPVRNTFYGPTWDVRAVQEAKNVAYTSQDLGFHQDLLYMANPPGLQALHVLTASSEGGESLFSDGAQAVEALLRSPDDYAHLDALFNFQVTFQYHNAGEWYRYTRPTLEGPRWVSLPLRAAPFPAYGRAFQAINWSPPFQAPLIRPCHPTGLVGSIHANYLREKTAWSDAEEDSYERMSMVQKYHAAARALQRHIEDPKHFYETRLEPRTCVIFNNRRILHARRAFTATGQQRWLRGAYGDLDSLHSLHRTASEQRTDSKQYLYPGTRRPLERFK